MLGFSSVVHGVVGPEPVRRIILVESACYTAVARIKSQRRGRFGGRGGGHDAPRSHWLLSGEKDTWVARAMMRNIRRDQYWPASDSHWFLNIQATTSKENLPLPGPSGQVPP